SRLRASASRYLYGVAVGMVWSQVELSRRLPTGLQHVQHTEALFHEGTQSFGADQAAVAVDQALSAALDSDTGVLHEEMTHVLVEQFAGGVHFRRLQQVKFREALVDVEGDLARVEAVEEAARPQRERRPVGLAVLKDKERHAPLLDIVA